MTAEARVIITVELDVTTLEMETAEPSTLTMKAEIAAVVEERASL